MTALDELLEKIDKLEKRYDGDPIDSYIETWLMPKELLIRVRDEIKKPGLFDEKYIFQTNLQEPFSG